VTHRAFAAAGLEAAWERVIAVVAQPGVEFGDDKVLRYNRQMACALSTALDGAAGLVFEAHSTDFQTGTALRQMVEDHFCVLKVGPALTFAYRQAMFAVEQLESELIPDGEKRSRLRQTLEEQMLASTPNHWQRYYSGKESERRFKRAFSFSDRSRYYWTNVTVHKAARALYANLEHVGIPPALISQFMPDLFEAVAEGSVGMRPHDLVLAHIRKAVTEVYSKACLLG
jgi:D-tagatose-1,6-bisphosphate aldolase subunit GatZ/KbaZ